MFILIYFSQVLKHLGFKMFHILQLYSYQIESVDCFHKRSQAFQTVICNLLLYRQEMHFPFLCTTWLEIPEFNKPYIRRLCITCQMMDRCQQVLSLTCPTWRHVSRSHWGEYGMHYLTHAMTSPAHYYGSCLQATSEIKIFELW